MLPHDNGVPGVESACDEMLISHPDDRLALQTHSAAAGSGLLATTTGVVGAPNLGLRWAKDTQVFYCDGVAFDHEGATDTEPSHDLAHLLVAANGGLPWRPAGTDNDARIAEYNAVFIEHLLDKTFNSIMYCPVEPDTILQETLIHARWFVDEHFAPFPVSAEEAYRRLCSNIDPPTITRLSPLFFNLRWRERTDPNYRLTGVEIQFSRKDVPAAAGKAQEFASVVGDLLGRMERSSRDNTSALAGAAS